MPQIRQIDQIETIIKTKYQLFTFDLSEEIDNLPPMNEIGSIPNNEFYNMQMNKRFKKMQVIELPPSQYSFADLFLTDLELSLVADPEDASQIQLKFQFQDAFHEYMFGNWTKALELFKHILNDFPKDGPTKFLKAFIEQEHDNSNARMKWTGFRKS